MLQTNYKRHFLVIYHSQLTAITNDEGNITVTSSMSLFNKSILVFVLHFHHLILEAHFRTRSPARWELSRRLIPVSFNASFSVLNSSKTIYWGSTLMKIFRPIHSFCNIGSWACRGYRQQRAKYLVWDICLVRNKPPASVRMEPTAADNEEGPERNGSRPASPPKLLSTKDPILTSFY